MSSPAKPSTTPRSEADRLYTYVKHKKAAQFWRGCNRNSSKTAREFSVDRSTIDTWRDNESWVAWADAADGKVAEKLQLVHESALTKHLKELDTLLSTGRTIVAQMQHEIASRYLQKASVDAIEVRQMAGALKAIVDAGATHYQLKTLNLHHGGEIKVSTDIAAEIEARLRKKIPGLTLIDYAKSKQPAA